MNEGEERVLAWMALLARPRSGPVVVRREVERAGDVLAAWRRFARAFSGAFAGVSVDLSDLSGQFVDFSFQFLTLSEARQRNGMEWNPNYR